MNRNYQAGVRLEREVVLLFKQYAWTAARTAGSHGLADLYAVQVSGLAPAASDFLRTAGWGLPQATGGFWLQKYSRLRSNRLQTLYVAPGTLEGSNHAFVLVQCKIVACRGRQRPKTTSRKGQRV